MATNKELVEQAVRAIPKWIAFLDKKQAEQNLILEQMQDDGFAPKTLTERLVDRFTSKKEKPELINQVSDEQQTAVKLEKDAPTKPQEEEKEETQETEEAEVTKISNQPISSNDGDRLKISNEDFKDIF